MLVNKRNSEFDVEYARFLKQHVRHRTGERLRRLRDGHGHAEREFLSRVWWPMFKQFEHLHPEFQVRDYGDGYRYIDFAYIRGTLRVGIEIDGYGPHLRNTTPEQFSDELRRQDYLVLDGWFLLRFSYSDVVSRPRSCQQIIQQLLGIWGSTSSEISKLSPLEREIVRLTYRGTGLITVKEVCQAMHIGPKLAYRVLHNLSDKQWLSPASGTVRIRRYKLHSTRTNVRL